MAKKTARPEMSWIESRKQWRKRIVLDGRSRDVYGKTQDDVRERVKELERQVDAGMVLDDNTTLIQFMREWFEIKAAGLAHNTAAMYANVINNHLSPFFKNMRISDAKPLHIQKLMAQKSEMSNSSQRHILCTTSQIFDAAEQNGLIMRNPCNGVKAGGEHAKPKIPLSREQQDTIVSATAETRAELFVSLCLYAGLRREESLGLQWSNVHLTDTPYIDVRNTVTFINNCQPHLSKKLKSRAAYRTIPIPPQLECVLRKARSKTNSVMVIPAATTGGAMSYSAFRRMWDIVEDGVEFYVTPHILRHTYITELCAAGMDIKKIQYLAGHEDVTMTLKVYAHVKDNSPAALSGDITRIFSGSSTGSKIEQTL